MQNTVVHRIRRFSVTNLVPAYEAIIAWRWLPWIIIGLGAALRLIQFAQNRSLWIDEVRLALNIIHRPFADLLLPLDYNQGSPLGFLVLQKIMVSIFGPTDTSLRLVALVGSLISLWLFWKVAQRVLSSRAIPLALVIFAIAGPMIYYGSEVKQYSTDVTITLAILFIGLEMQTGSLTWLRVVMYGLGGAILLWFAHPSIFVLAGIGGVLTLTNLFYRDRSRLPRVVVISLIWFASFIAFYAVNLRNLTSNDYLEVFWSFGFMPLKPVKLVEWLVFSFYDAIGFSAGLTRTGLAGFMFLIGFATLVKRNWIRCLLLVSPIGLVLVASALHTYPFANRLALFLGPIFVLFIAEGIEALRGVLTQEKSASPTRGVMLTASFVLLGLLFFDPLWIVVTNLDNPHLYNSTGEEDMKSVMQYLEDNIQPGDIVYAYYNSVLPFEYYARQYNLQDIQIIKGIGDERSGYELGFQDYLNELDGLRGNQRVWLMFSHVHAQKGFNEEQFFVYNLDQMGLKLDMFQADGASIYLYDLSSAAES